jgi:endoglycosylceramidase
VAEAWQNFYLDRDGIQSELVRSWAVLAGSFAADPAVAGYDLLNEPNPGLVAAGPSDLALLGLFYQRALAAIRAAERGAPHGLAHIGFIEPMATWSALSVGVSPGLTFPADPDVVYSPHLYGGSINAVPLPVSFGFDEARREAALYGAAWWTGEWGWFGDPATDGASVAAFGALEDQYLVGGAWWQWKQACGDPHTIGSPGAAPAAVADGLNRYACPSGRSLGQPAELVRVLDRGFPRAVPGVLRSVRSDPLEVQGETDRPGLVELWIPGTKRPVVSPPAAVLTQVPGGWLASVAVARGPYSVSVKR